MPQITVVTVCRNSIDTIPHTIHSVLTQDLRELDYLIIDGASDDGTAEIAQSFATHDPRIRVISEPDQGIYDAMNKGIRLAKGDYIHFLNADDTYVDSMVLSKVAAAIKADNHASDIYYGNLQYRQPDGSADIHFRPSGNIRKFVRTGCVTQQAIIYHRDVLRKVGPFNQKYSIVGDYEWLLRALFRHDITATYLDLDIANFRLMGASTNPIHRARLHREKERLYFRFLPRKYLIRRLRGAKRRLQMLSPKRKST
jgi:glycosyltransferase involved in cell wall biosynthesis